MTNPPREIVAESELREALGRDRFLLFKHSLTCPISAHAFAEYGAFAPPPDLTTGWLDVRARRALSQWVESSSGVRHQSPQAILFVRGKPVWHASHHSITRESLARALAQAGV
jgi:bacillithiol system protein YtxJ